MALNNRTKAYNKRLTYILILIVFMGSCIGIAFMQQGLRFFQDISMICYCLAAIILLVTFIKSQIMDIRHAKQRPLMCIQVINNLAVKKGRRVKRIICFCGTILVLLCIYCDWRYGIGLMESIKDSSDLIINLGIWFLILSTAYNLDEINVYEDGILSLMYFAKWSNIIGYKVQRYPNKKGDSYALQLKLKKKNAKKQALFPKIITIWVEQEQIAQIEKLMETKNIPYCTYM